MTKTTIIQIIPATVQTFALYSGKQGNSTAPIIAWALVAEDSESGEEVRFLKGLTALNTKPGDFADSHPDFQKYIHSTQLGLNHYIRYQAGLLPRRTEPVSND